MTELELRRCSCGQVIEMRKHQATGFVAPINPTAMPGGDVPPGNIRVNEDGTYAVVSNHDRKRMQASAAAVLRLNHFVTCPDRAAYRRHHSGRGA